MAVTERVVVLMSSAEKAALDAEAVQAYDEEAEMEADELRGLLTVLAATHQETLRQLDRAEHKLDEKLAYLARLSRPSNRSS